jgi:alkylated DNA repair dioxygenase AlkB
MIPGLRYIPGYLDAAAHDALMAAIDAAPWRDLGERRAQIYGYSYHYTKGGLYRVDDLPTWAQDLAARVERDRLMAELADQLIVNDYAAGKGIPAHVDAPLFTDTIVSISLGSSCVMEFTQEAAETKQQFLEPRSALLIGGAARHEWKHAIPGRPVDEWQGREWPRGRRVSLTFRKVLPPDQRPTWEPASWGKLSETACRPPSRANRVPTTPHREPRSTP